MTIDWTSSKNLVCCFLQYGYHLKLPNARHYRASPYLSSSLRKSCSTLTLLRAPLTYIWISRFIFWKLWLSTISLNLILYSMTYTCLKSSNSCWRSLLNSSYFSILDLPSGFVFSKEYTCKYFIGRIKQCNATVVGTFHLETGLKYGNDDSSFPFIWYLFSESNYFYQSA